VVQTSSHNIPSAEEVARDVLLTDALTVVNIAIFFGLSKYYSRDVCIYTSERSAMYCYALWSLQCVLFQLSCAAIAMCVCCASCLLHYVIDCSGRYSHVACVFN
jgi:glucan phosphoethanolaminetransferase (alkaline phosphatase superfamily)